MIDKAKRFALANIGFLFVLFLLIVAVCFFIVPDTRTIDRQATQISSLTKEVSYLKSLIEPKCPPCNDQK